MRAEGAARPHQTEPPVDLARFRGAIQGSEKNFIVQPTFAEPIRKDPPGITRDRLNKGWRKPGGTAASGICWENEGRHDGHAILLGSGQRRSAILGRSYGCPRRGTGTVAVMVHGSGAAGDGPDLSMTTNTSAAWRGQPKTPLDEDPWSPIGHPPGRQSEKRRHERIAR